MPQNKISSHQSGNVFVIILITIILFAALMYSFTRNTRTSVSNLSQHQVKIAAQEILNYARIAEEEVNIVRQKGCSEEDISFENNFVSGYRHFPLPPRICQIFDTEGGQMIYIAPEDDWTNSTQQWQFNAQFQIEGIATTCNNASCADLNIHLEDVDSGICAEINSILNVDSPTIPSDSGYDFTTFIGDFAVPTDLADETSSSALRGQSTGCVRVGSINYFYHILLAR